MSSSIKSIACAVAALVSATWMQAVPLNITLSLPLSPSSTLVSDVPKNGVGSSGAENIFNWLTDDVALYNSLFSAALPTPVGGGSSGFDPGFSTSSSTADLTGYSYAVLHYGVGKGGKKGSGGGLQIWYLNGTTGSYDFGAAGDGPNGYGGISYLRLYEAGSNVPDAGFTAAYLGLALFSLAAVRRRLTA